MLNIENLKNGRKNIVQLEENWNGCVLDQEEKILEQTGLNA
jgi:hypothetical protein